VNLFLEIHRVGIVEAASFGKYVINVGNRQLGRESGSNVLHVQADAQKLAL